MAIDPLTIGIIIVVIYLISSIKILPEYERGVIFRLGRVLPQPKGPGIILVFAPIDRIVRMSLRIETVEVPAQDVVTLGLREGRLFAGASVEGFVFLQHATARGASLTVSWTPRLASGTPLASSLFRHSGRMPVAEK